MSDQFIVIASTLTFVTGMVSGYLFNGKLTDHSWTRHGGQWYRNNKIYYRVTNTVLTSSLNALVNEVTNTKEVTVEIRLH